MSNETEGFSGWPTSDPAKAPPAGDPLADPQPTRVRYTVPWNSGDMLVVPQRIRAEAEVELNRQLQDVPDDHPRQLEVVEAATRMVWGWAHRRAAELASKSVDVLGWLRDHPIEADYVLRKLKILGPWQEGYTSWGREDLTGRVETPFPVMEDEDTHRWWDANAACPGDGYEDAELGENWATFAEAAAAMDARAVAAGWVLTPQPEGSTP